MKGAKPHKFLGMVEQLIILSIIENNNYASVKQIVLTIEEKAGVNYSTYYIYTPINRLLEKNLIEEIADATSVRTFKVNDLGRKNLLTAINVIKSFETVNEV